MGKFVIKTMKNGEFTFSLKATNGQEILAAGEGFKTLATCKNSIESVKKNALSHVEDQTVEGFETKTHPKFEVYLDKAGEYRFRLKARNGAYAEVFRTTWIPLEEAYFSACGVEACCDITLKSE